MLKNLIICFLIFALGALTFNNESQAFFFKKKTDKKATKAEQVKEEAKEKKVLVVEIFASWCPGCKNIQPTLDQLVKEAPEINLIQLDVSTPSKAKVAEKTAKELNIADFFQLNKSKTATVAIIVPSSGETVSIFQNNNDIEDYKTSVEEAKTKEKALHQG